MESNVFHDSQHANLVSNENADTKYGLDQAETHLVKLVDGKLVPTAETGDMVTDDDLRNRYANDEERGLNTPNQRTYDLVDTDAGDMTQANALTDEMVPATPSTPDPNNPVPAAPETPQPPTPHQPGPEIPNVPTTPQTPTPEITEPPQPGRSHEINNLDDPSDSITNQRNTDATPTSAIAPREQVPDEARQDLDEGIYAGLEAGPEDEGMSSEPRTGDSAHPYDVDRKDTSYQPGERPQESAQMMSQPRETLDESAVKKGPMGESNTAEAPSDMKSTDQLDTKYNDLDAAKADVM